MTGASKEPTTRPTSRRPDGAAPAGRELDRVVAACQAGDRDAMRRLYELCSERVYRLMVRMAGLQEAADLTQDVFLHVLRKIDGFAGKSRFETWLYRVAANRALEHLRRRPRRAHQPLAVDPEDRRRRTGERTEQRELLEAALERIDPELRTVFLLRESEELSYRQIAEALGVPEGTVGSRLNRARRELRDRLNELGWGNEP